MNVSNWKPTALRAIHPVEPGVTLTPGRDPLRHIASAAVQFRRQEAELSANTTATTYISIKRREDHAEHLLQSDACVSSTPHYPASGCGCQTTFVPGYCEKPSKRRWFAISDDPRQTDSRLKGSSADALQRILVSRRKLPR